MKLSLKKFAILAGVALASAPLAAQSTYSGYFIDNYNYRYQMNPAFGNEGKGFVGMPVLGNMNIGVRGTLHLTDILYYKDGKNMLFTNPEISTSEAMGKFENMNRLGLDMKLNLINFGFKAFGGYNTVGVGVVAGAHLSAPKMLFSLVK